MKNIRRDPRFCYRYKGVFEEFLMLNSEEECKLKQFISDNFKPTKTFNLRHTSYGLKHFASDALGFYIGNADMKRVMTECGFKAMDESALNWTFNVSQKSIDACIKKMRKGAAE